MTKKSLGSVSTWFLGIVLIIGILIFAALILMVGRGNEDTWIKDSKGIWIKHGNPSFVPDYVLEQQNAIGCANNLYNQAKSNNLEFNSQCLGTCKNYSIDIVHVPRIKEDNLAENQCSDYINKITKNFIELDESGNIVRIAQ